MTNGRTFRRAEAARFLQAHGLRTTPASLATMATRGGGPPYFKIGKLCQYPTAELELWVSRRCTDLFDSTSAPSGRRIDDLFEQECDLEYDRLNTGDPGFDEVTRLLAEEEALQEAIDSAGVKYDQQLL